MPVLIPTKCEAEQWLEAPPEEALQLQKPAAEDAIVLLSVVRGSAEARTVGGKVPGALLALTALLASTPAHAQDFDGRAPVTVNGLLAICSLYDQPTKLVMIDELRLRHPDTALAALDAALAIEKGWMKGEGSPPHSVCLADEGRRLAR